MTRALAVVALLALLAAAAPAGAATIHVSGSTTAQPLVTDLAWFYRHDVRRPARFTIVGGGSEAGVADAARGIVDLGLASRPPQPTDPAGLVYTPFAASGVCLVTHRANPLPGMSRATVQALVSGAATRWDQVAGSPRADAIVPVAQGVGTGARSVFLTTFVDVATELGYAPRTFSTAVQVRDFVRATPAAWGYVDLAYAGGLHVVPYEGVGCTRATVADSRYPARRELAFVTAGPPRGAEARFVRWVLTSRTARRVIATRYVPVG